VTVPGVTVPGVTATGRRGCSTGSWRALCSQEAEKEDGQLPPEPQSPPHHGHHGHQPSPPHAGPLSEERDHQPQNPPRSRPETPRHRPDRKHHPAPGVPDAQPETAWRRTSAGGQDAASSREPPFCCLTRAHQLSELCFQVIFSIRLKHQVPSASPLPLRPAAGEAEHGGWAAPPPPSPQSPQAATH